MNTRARSALCVVFVASAGCVHYGAQAEAPAEPPREDHVAPVPPPPPPPQASELAVVQPAAPAQQVDGVNLLRGRCNGGDLESCAAVGTVYWQLRHDEVRGRAFLQKACDGGNQLGCAQLKALANAIATGDFNGDTPAKGLGSGGAYFDGTSGGSMVQDWLGEEPTTPGDMTPMLTGLVSGLQKECTAGQQQACVALAMFYWKGKFAPKDRDKARQLLQVACTAGEKSGCSVLKRLDAKGAASGSDSASSSSVVVVPDVVVSSDTMGDATALTAGLAQGIVGMLQQKCDAKNEQSCVGLGMLYWEGKLAPKDRDKARQLLQGACDAGDSNGCQVLKGLADMP